MWNKISLYFHTLKYLKSVQLQYRLIYFFRNKWRKITGFKYDFTNNSSVQIQSLKFVESINNYPSFIKKNEFIFLNLTKDFGEKIDWNFNGFGKLWTYNLTYFDFLNQSDFDKEIGLELIRDFNKNLNKVKDGLEPFPISLRILNWVKFLSKNKINNEQINTALFNQAKVLEDNLEYHILGNHLLENAFALLYAAYFFQEKSFLVAAEKILLPELEEQILSDGAHFELSPMYHQLMLFRVLESINLIENNELSFSINVLDILKDKAGLMLGWLERITFKSGEIPLINDSAKGIAPTSQMLFALAKRLNISVVPTPLGESGYRKVNNKNYELIVDIGNISPNYLPAHSHSDTFNFLIQKESTPFLIEKGISTYEKNSKRKEERSTSSHNTVVVDGKEQSKVWGGFRVGKRAIVTKIDEKEGMIKACHNGYRTIGINHCRAFTYNSDQIIIEDELIGKKAKNITGLAYFHLHPSVKIEQNSNATISTNLGEFYFENFENIQIQETDVFDQFNTSSRTKKICVTFKERLLTKINL